MIVAVPTMIAFAISVLFIISSQINTRRALRNLRPGAERPVLTGPELTRTDLYTTQGEAFRRRALRHLYVSWFWLILAVVLHLVLS